MYYVELFNTWHSYIFHDSFQFIRTSWSTCRISLINKNSIFFPTMSQLSQIYFRDKNNAYEIRCLCYHSWFRYLLSFNCKCVSDCSVKLKYQRRTIGKFAMVLLLWILNSISFVGTLFSLHTMNATLVKPYSNFWFVIVVVRQGLISAFYLKKHTQARSKFIP